MLRFAVAEIPTCEVVEPKPEMMLVGWSCIRERIWQKMPVKIGFEVCHD